jgi:hypothetical protein
MAFGPLNVRDSFCDSGPTPIGISVQKAARLPVVEIGRHAVRNVAARSTEPKAVQGDQAIHPHVLVLVELTQHLIAPPAVADHMGTSGIALVHPQLGYRRGPFPGAEHDDLLPGPAKLCGDLLHSSAAGT